MFISNVTFLFDSPHSISTEIKTISFKIIVELGFQSSIEPDKNQDIIKSLLPFFRTIFEFIFCELVKNNDHYLRDTVALALYSLLCCYKTTYRENVREVLRLIGNYEAEEAICNSLIEIIDQIGLDCTVNQNRLAFKKRFSEFINKLHTMLSLR